MTKDLLSEIDAFLSELEQCPLVLLLHRYDQEIQSLRLDRLLAESERLQSEAKRQPYDIRKKMLSEAKAKYDEYQNHPLVLNRKSVRTELLDALAPLHPFAS